MAAELQLRYLRRAR